MPDKELQALADALADACRLLERHGDKWVSGRLRELEQEARRGEADAAIGAVTEATGSMGSFNDRILYRSNGDSIEPRDERAVNAELREKVRIVEEKARAAAAAHGLELLP